MWIHVERDGTAFNTAHVSRLFVEETGSAAALKAEVAGRTHMIAYVINKSAGQELLRQIMEAARERHEAFVVSVPKL